MNSVIKIKDLTVSYSGADAINGINLDIKRGEFLSLIGQNGGGKTTLLNAILGFLKATSGTVEIMPENTAISYVPQIASMDRNFPITVLETVMTAFLKSGLHPFKIFKTEEQQKATELLRLLGLEQYKNRQIAELSGGEFQRLIIARALAADPEILLLDEPTANVDIASRDKIFSTLKELNSKGLTIIVVTHDLSAACSYSTRLALINRELVYCGAPVINENITKILYGAKPKESGSDNNA